MAFDFSSAAERSAARHAGSKKKKVCTLLASFDSLFPEETEKSGTTLNILQNHAGLACTPGILLSQSFLVLGLMKF